MQLDDKTVRAHQFYLNHALACLSCHPPTKRYCFEGSRLYLLYQAHYLLSHPLEVRRAMLQRVEARSTEECDALKECVMHVHSKTKEDASELAEDAH